MGAQKILRIILLQAFLPRDVSSQGETKPSSNVKDTLDEYLGLTPDKGIDMLEERGTWYKADYEALTDGLAKIGAGKRKRSSEVAAFGPKAFPVALGEYGFAVIAGSTRGKGRVVTAGRMEWIFEEVSDSMTHLVKNAVGWLANGKNNPRVASREGHTPPGIKWVKTEVPISDLDKGKVDIYCIDAHYAVTDEEAEALAKFVEGGGGLLAGGQAWAWGSENKGNYPNYPGNKYLTKFGLLIGPAERLNPSYAVGAEPPPPEINLFYAARSLAQDSYPTGNEVAARTFVRAFGETFRAEGVAAIKPVRDVYEDLSPRLVVYPVFLSAMLDVIVKTEMAKGNITGLEDLKAPDVFVFPGNVDGDALRVTKTVTVNGDTNAFKERQDHMLSTGLYVAPSEVVKVNVPKSLVGKAKILVGCHTDSNWKRWRKGQRLKRAPVVHIRFTVTKPDMEVINPYGGLLYIVVAPGSKFGRFDVTISNAIEAPHFILDKTDEDEWNRRIKKLPAPWAELEVPGEVILSVPSSAIRGLDKPNELLRVHERAYRAASRFAGVEPRLRTERFVLDIQTRGGGAHAGYPMVGRLKLIPELLNATHLTKVGTWGYYHELGHIHQVRSWTPKGTGETTCNFWSIIMNRVSASPCQVECRQSSSSGIRTQQCQQQKGIRPSPDSQLRSKNFKKDWKGWLAFDTYDILGDEFGWESYSETIKTYLGQPMIRSNNKKLNEWAKRYSKVVNKNLYPYFKWWGGWPITKETKKECAELPKMDKNLIKAYDHPTDQCQQGWISYGDECFFKSKKKLSWLGAKKRCASIGAHLATCLTEKEFHFLDYNTKEAHWFGIRKRFRNKDPRDWVNLDGSKADIGRYTWRRKRPSKNRRRKCGAITKDKAEDRECKEKQKFICKKGPAACQKTHQEP